MIKFIARQDPADVILILFFIVLFCTIAFFALQSKAEREILDSQPCTRVHPNANDILDCQATRQAATAEAK